MTQLQNKQLQLRVVDSSDQDLLDRLSGRPDVQHFVGQVKLPSGAMSPSCFTILERGARVGIVVIVSSDALEGKDVELVCALLPDAEGRGIAKEACARTLDWAFDTMAVQRIIACIDNQNAPGRKLAERLFMKRMGPRSFRDETIYVRYRDGAA